MKITQGLELAWEGWRRLLALLLVLFLVPTGWAECRPYGPAETSLSLVKAGQEAYAQDRQNEATIEPCQQVQESQDNKQEQAPLPEPVKINSKLLEKNVKVYYRDGRIIKGKLILLTGDSIWVETRDRIKRIPLAEVARVDKHRSKARLWAYIIGAAAAGAGLFLLIGAEVWDD